MRMSASMQYSEAVTHRLLHNTLTGAGLLHGQNALGKGVPAG